MPKLISNFDHGESICGIYIFVSIRSKLNFSLSMFAIFCLFVCLKSACFCFCFFEGVGAVMA